MGAEMGRVAYLVSWFPAVTETFILEEVRDLRERGVEIDVFPLFGKKGGQLHGAFRALERCTHYTPNASLELLAAQLHWLRRRPLAYLKAWWTALRKTAPSRKLFVRAPAVVAKAALVARRLEAAGVRHVHAHWATHPTLAAWVIRELTGIGYSFTTHAHDLYVDTAMLREKVDDARFVVTISDFNRALLEIHCGRPAAEKVHVVRCGVDLGAFSPGPRERPLRPTFVCVAGLRDYKGHDVLLDACRILAGRGVDARTLLVGDGPLRRRLEARIRKEGLAGSVELLGALPHEKIPEVLARATAMVLPSVRARDGQMEGIPVALMEAMAAGLPVVSTRLSGVPELIEDGVSGLLVPERDPAALAGAMARLAGDPALAARLAEAGRRTVRERFDRRRNVAKLERLLAAVAATPEAAAADAAAAPAARPARGRAVPAPAAAGAYRRRLETFRGSGAGGVPAATSGNDTGR